MSLEQYDAVCKEQFQRISDKLDKLQESNDTIHKRLYMDNGSPCIQTRLDRNERLWKTTLWIVSIVFAANIAQMTRTFWMTHSSDSEVGNSGQVNSK